MPPEASADTGWNEPRPPVEPYVDPRCTALLVIDMQNGFCHPESRMEKSGVGVRHQQAIVPAVLRLVELARGWRLPILWSQQVHFPEDVTRRRRRISNVAGSSRRPRSPAVTVTMPAPPRGRRRARGGSPRRDRCP